jgi:outer membrane immunogenic protein
MLAALLGGLLVQQVQAADPNSWSGCYAGGNLAYAESKFKMNRVTDGERIGSTTADGALYGGQIGCDLQKADWVFGGQLAFSGTSVKGDHLFANGSGPHDDVNYDMKSFGALTGRAGYQFSPKTLAYVKGGLAWSRTNYEDADPAPIVGAAYSGDNTKSRNGWLFGVGVEHRYNANLSVFVDYNYIDFDKRKVTINTGDGDIDRYNFKQSMDYLSVGLNYRF